MGAAASTSDSKEFRDLHTALTASGNANRTTNMSDIDDGAHFGRIERLANRLINAEKSMSKNHNNIRIDQVDPGYKTTLLFAAAAAGGEECLTVIRLLRKYSSTKELFLRALSWRDPTTGLTTLHVAKDGKAAACLLRAGCKCLETREFKQGLTPLQYATFNDNADLVSVLHAWGASDNGPPNTEMPFVKNRATAIALFNTVPERPQGNLCWLILHDLIPLAGFIGVQFMTSPKISELYVQWNIEEVPVPMNVLEEDEDVEGDARFDQNTLATKRDLIEIKYLPEKFKEAAYLFDLDASGTITMDELKKMIVLKERRRGDTAKIDTSPCNAYAGGAVLVQANQRQREKNSNNETKESLWNARHQPSAYTMRGEDEEYNEDKFDTWHDLDKDVPKYETTSVNIGFNATLPMTIFNFEHQQSKARSNNDKERHEASQRNKQQVLRGVMVDEGMMEEQKQKYGRYGGENDGEKGRPRMTTSYLEQQETIARARAASKAPATEAAGSRNNMSLLCGAESGDTPSFLKLTPLGESMRSVDLRTKYLDSGLWEQQLSQPTLPKSYTTETWKQLPSGWKPTIAKTSDTFATTMEAALKKEEQVKGDALKNQGLWRPIGSRCSSYGITDADHITAQNIRRNQRK